MTMTEEAAVPREAVPMSVLVVDDEQTGRDTCAAVAAQSGMKAIAVATAEEALEVLDHSAVGILLTDLKLPRANGVELLKLVHDLQEQQDQRNAGQSPAQGRFSARVHSVSSG